MALTYRFYRAPQIGTPGSLPDAPRNKLTQYIVADGSGADFHELIHVVRPVRYTLAICESAVHATIAADTTITPLSAELANLAAVNAWLELTASTIPPAIQTQLESDGFNFGWVDVLTTRRHLLRYISRVHVVAQNLKRIKNADSLVLFSRALEDRWSDLTATQRTKIRDWMIAKGLAVGAITNATRLRAVIHTILTGVEWTPLPLGPDVVL